MNGLVGTLSRMFSSKHDLADKLQNAGTSSSQSANSVLAVMVGASVELAQGRILFQAPKVEDLFLTPPPALTIMLTILIDQSDVAKNLMTAKHPEVLEGYVTEMLRIDPPIQGTYREAKANETIGSTTIKAGDLVYLDIASANNNVSFFFFFLRRGNGSHRT